MAARFRRGQGGKAKRHRAPVLAAGTAAAMLLAGMALAAPPAAADGKAKKTAPVDLEQPLASLLEGQRSTSVALSELRQQLEDARKAAAELREELRQQREGQQASIRQLNDELKEMREEVRGLYVESSGLKGDVAKVGEEVDGLGSGLDGFRLSAGIVVAAVVVLQLVLVALGLRGRG